MTDAPLSHPLRFADLPQRKTTRVTLEPKAKQLAAIARDLDVTAVRKLRFQVELHPGPGADWTLNGALGATVVQPCGVTLDPVTTRIEEDVARRFVAHWEDTQDEEEIEMTVDETTEPLEATVDLGAVMIEALALAIPSFPRAAGVEPVNLTAAPEGATPLTDDAVKPFAGLAALKAQLDAKDGDA